MLEEPGYHHRRVRQIPDQVLCHLIPKMTVSRTLVGGGQVTRNDVLYLPLVWREGAGSAGRLINLMLIDIYFLLLEPRRLKSHGLTGIKGALAAVFEPVPAVRCQLPLRGLIVKREFLATQHVSPPTVCPLIKEGLCAAL
jgi:hypothetical protein